jgi:hypothetical protein
VTAIATAVATTVATAAATTVATALIAPLEGQIAGIQTQITGINNQLTEINSEIGTLETDVDALQYKTQFLSSDGTTTNFNNGGENVASLTSSLITLKKELILQQSASGNSQMTIENTSTSNAVLILKSNQTQTRFLTDSTGAFKLTQRNTSTSNVAVTGLELYPNAVLSTGSKTNNKVISLYEAGSVSDDPSTATNFSGFGVSTNTLRYQVPLTTDTHRFFNGSTENFSINGSVISCAPNFTLDRSQVSGEVRITASNTATTGTSSYILKTNNGTQTSKLYMDQTGLVKFDNGSITALEVYSNGVLTAGKRAQNKVFSLYDMAASDTPA